MSKKMDFIHADLIDTCTPNCNLSVISWSLLLFSCSVVSSLGNPTDFSTTGFPILHHLPEFAQTHVHWVSDAIQPSYPLPPLSPLALNLSQHHSLFLFYIYNYIQAFPDSSVGKECTCNEGDPCLIPGSGRSTGKGIGYPLQYSWASLVAQLVKNPPAMWWDLSLIPGLGRSPGEGKS